jgi:hypothetical protein
MSAKYSLHMGQGAAMPQIVFTVIITSTAVYELCDNLFVPTGRFTHIKHGMFDAAGQLRVGSLHYRA